MTSRTNHRRWTIWVSAALVCLMFLEGIQLSGYARAQGVKKTIISSRFTDSQIQMQFDRLSKDLQRVIASCRVPTFPIKNNKNITKSIPSMNNTLSSCPQLAQWFATAPQRVATTGVIEFSVIGSIWTTLTAMAAGATVAVLAKIAVVIALVLVVIGVAWCVINPSQCKTGAQNIRDWVLNEFNTKIFPLFKKAIGDSNQQRINQFKNQILGHFNASWNNAVSQIQSGVPPQSVLDAVWVQVKQATKQIPQPGNQKKGSNGSSNEGNPNPLPPSRGQAQPSPEPEPQPETGGAGSYDGPRICTPQDIQEIRNSIHKLLQENSVYLKPASYDKSVIKRIIDSVRNFFRNSLDWSRVNPEVLNQQLLSLLQASTIASPPSSIQDSLREIGSDVREWEFEHNHVIISCRGEKVKFQLYKKVTNSQNKKEILEKNYIVRITTKRSSGR